MVFVVSQVFEHISKQRLGLPRVVHVVDVFLKLVHGFGDTVAEVLRNIRFCVILLILKVDDFRDIRNGLFERALGRSALMARVLVGHVDAVAVAEARAVRRGRGGVEWDLQSRDKTGLGEREKKTGSLKESRNRREEMRRLFLRPWGLSSWAESDEVSGWERESKKWEVCFL